MAESSPDTRMLLLCPQEFVKDLESVRTNRTAVVMTILTACFGRSMVLGKLPYLSMKSLPDAKKASPLGEAKLRHLKGGDGVEPKNMRVHGVWVNVRVNTVCVCGLWVRGSPCSGYLNCIQRCRCVVCTYLYWGMVHGGAGVFCGLWVCDWYGSGVEVGSGCGMQVWWRGK